VAAWGDSGYGGLIYTADFDALHYLDWAIITSIQPNDYAFAAITASGGLEV
jgi:hypothetical protein